MTVGKAGTGHIGKFGAVEPHPFSAVGHCHPDVGEQTDIGPQGHPCSIGGDCRQLTQRLQFLQTRGVILLQTPVFGSNRLVGVQVDIPRGAVHDHAVFDISGLQKPLHAHNGRDAQ